MERVVSCVRAAIARDSSRASWRYWMIRSFVGGAGSSTGRVLKPVIAGTAAARASNKFTSRRGETGVGIGPRGGHDVDGRGVLSTWFVLACLVERAGSDGRHR